MSFNACYVKQVTYESRTYYNKVFDLNEEYLIPDSDRIGFMSNLALLSDVVSGAALIGNGTEYFDDIGFQLDWLRNRDINARDDENHLEIKQVMAKDTYHYEPRSLDFTTAKYNSLYNRKHDGNCIPDGTDYGDAFMYFYNVSGVAMERDDYDSDEDFQLALSNSVSGCCKTVVKFIPDYDYSIKSGVLMLAEEWDYDGYVWCLLAPDIPEAWGGQAPFLAGGYNMRFFPARSYIRMDGQTTFHILQDLVYYSHVIGLVVKHDPGDQKGIQMIYEHYKE